MAKEKFIRGKRDDAKHDGLYSNTKRKQQAEHELKDFMQGTAQEEVVVYEKDKEQKKK